MVHISIHYWHLVATDRALVWKVNFWNISNKICQRGLLPAVNCNLYFQNIVYFVHLFVAEINNDNLLKRKRLKLFHSLWSDSILSLQSSHNFTQQLSDFCIFSIAINLTPFLIGQKWLVYLWIMNQPVSQIRHLWSVDPINR